MSYININEVSIEFSLYHNKSPSLKEYFANLFKRHNDDKSLFTAVNNVSVRINPGDRVGIVGHNGAGKSTLLKSLCGVYEPSKGSIEVDGKIAPLLEIGAGFHPEFTGRENIFLNGAILGYSRSDIKAIEEEVITFAELEAFIDTPVKYYSTGMYMRLAFSLATAMQPDILILDEVFAGGDASFREKARARMCSLIDNANIMVMVSHDEKLIESLCNRLLLMDHGRLIADGTPENVMKQYADGKKKISV